MSSEDGSVHFVAPGSVAFGSSVMGLLEVLASSGSTQALRWLRRPVLLSRPPSLLERVTLKVVAKRWALVAEEGPHSTVRPLAADLVEAAAQCRDRLLRGDALGQAMGLPTHGADHLPEEDRALMASLAGGRIRGAESILAVLDGLAARAQRRERSIAAALLDGNGNVVRLAFNQPDAGPIWHAEYLVLRAHLAEGQRPLPRDATLLVTRKPCRMCAALIVQELGSAGSGSGSRTLARYLHDDPGPLARQTVLDEGSADRALWLAEGAGGRHRVQASDHTPWGVLVSRDQACDGSPL